MKPLRRLMLAAAAWLSAVGAFAGEGAGTSSGVFLTLPADAVTAALGGAAAAAQPAPSAVLGNPAGLAGSETAFSFSHALLVEDISYDVLGAAVPLGEAGVIGAGAQYLKYGTFDSLYNNGDPAGALSPKDSAFALGWGMPLNDDIMAGAAFKYIDSRISGSAATSSMDLGFLINGEEVAVGFTAQNMGKGLKFNKESSPLPVNIKLGVYIPYWESWKLAADFNFPKDGAAWVGVGAEYAFIVKDTWTLFGRAGYNTAANDTDGINGVSAGFGLSRKTLAFDYAFRTMGILGSTHHLGLSYRLGQ